MHGYLNWLGINDKICTLIRTSMQCACQSVKKYYQLPVSITVKQQHGWSKQKLKGDNAGESERFIPCFLSELLISDSAGATTMGTQSQLDILEDCYKSNCWKSYHDIFTLRQYGIIGSMQLMDIRLHADWASPSLVLVSFQIHSI